MNPSDISADVERYYTGKLKAHGATPRGVDWNGAESQSVRFAQLAKILEGVASGTLADVGCGYGGFLPFLRRTGFTGHFTGVDLSFEMIAAAKAMSHDDADASFVVGDAPPGRVDVVTASGIFGVKLTHSDDVWRDHLVAMLDRFNAAATRGFAFNCLTAYSDRDKMRPDLYYADPLFIFDHCKRAYAKNVALLHDYGLYEFTILVRK